MKFTVITVCYNEEKNINKTIQSVLRQTSADYEYVICDGLSKDRTVEIARSYTEAFSKKNIPYRIYSEKDGGIYQGMNNGADRAEGDYIIYMNAGDMFYDENVLKTVGDYIGGGIAAEVLYGNTAVVNRNVCHIVTGMDRLLEDGMSMCHQSIFVSTQWIQRIHFDVAYKIEADYDLMLNLKDAGCRFAHIDTIVSCFALGGISSSHPIRFLKEKWAIRKAHKLKIHIFGDVQATLISEIISTAIALIPLKIWHWWSTKIKNKTLVGVEE